MRNKWITRIIFIVGFILCCLPTFYGMYTQQKQSDAVSTYRSKAGSQDDTYIEDLIADAKEYNDMLYQSGGAIVDGMDSGILSDENYYKQLSVNGSDAMGSLEIPKINVNLPIYHGTEDEALSNGIGHLQGSSLPVGGENTHCVLTGHRGLPSSKLLVRLDEMEEGDLFFIRVCGNTYAYRVTEIQVVEPDEISVTDIQPEKDLVSLITCTPYGINTHRLVVTGERVEYSESEYKGIDEVFPSAREVILTALPFVLLAIAVIMMIVRRKKNSKYPIY